MTSPVNAAPMTIFNAINDVSITALVPVPEDLPTHLPHFYTYAQKGPSGPQMVSGDSMVQMFGVNTFDPTKPYYTHASVFINTVNAQGNSIMLERLQPSDATPPATLRLSLDLLAGQVPEYMRNQDGTYALDSNGNLQTTGQTVTGFTAKWVVTQAVDSQGNANFGAGTQNPGDQSAGQVQSIRYPIMDFIAPYFGADANNYGIRIWADTQTSSTPIDARILTNEKVYPFRIQVVYRPDSLTTPQIVATQVAEQYLNFCLKPNTIDSNTDAQLYLGSIFIDAYQNLDDPVNPPQYGPFGNMFIYDANVQTILTEVYTAEVPYITSDGDFTGATGEQYLFNLFTGKSSTNVPYTSYVINTTSSNAVALSSGTTMYAAGGSDGTMNEQLFGQLVATAVAEYADPNSPLQDSAKYPQSFMYDSGFPLATKKAMAAFISTRKNTFLVLGTHDTSGPMLTASQDSSIGLALETALQLYPESSFYGTSTVRAMIIPRSGRLLQSTYPNRLPLTLEVARKAAAYMGAGNGIWKNGLAFDQSPANQVTMFTDISTTFTPASVRNKDWANGLVGVQSFGRRSYFFPAFKTVYNNDTSVLNSFFTAACMVELENVGERAWRTFSGVSNLSNAQLASRVEAFVIANTQGRFDKRFTITPTCYFTAADIARGYSWSLNIAVQAPNMKTVETLSITAERLATSASNSSTTTSAT